MLPESQGMRVQGRGGSMEWAAGHHVAVHAVRHAQPTCASLTPVLLDTTNKTGNRIAASLPEVPLFCCRYGHIDPRSNSSSNPALRRTDRRRSKKQSDHIRVQRTGLAGRIARIP